MLVSVTAPVFYAVVYHCPCGCQPLKRDVDYVSPANEYEDLANATVDAWVRASAEAWAAELRARGYLDVRVEPRYATPDVDVN